MSSSTLDLPIEQAPRTGKGHGTSALGPSDSSDSGSDLQGAGDDGGAPGGVITPTGRSIGDADIDSDTDSHGTGEVRAAGRDVAVEDAADISVDRVVSADEAGLGTGLDQAEEAQLGVTDEEIDAQIRSGRADQLAQRDAIRDIERDGSLAGEATADASDAIAGGVSDDELMDQIRSGSDSEADAQGEDDDLEDDDLEDDDLEDQAAMDERGADEADAPGMVQGEQR
jgi:hypothetical protein